jgi:hypothetical protein
MIFCVLAIGVISTYIDVGVVVIDGIDGVNSAVGANTQEGWMKNLCETPKFLALQLARISGTVTCTI